MATEKEHAVKVRALKLLRIIVENPFVHTKKKLAEKLQVDESTIKRTFDDFKTAGFEVIHDERFRYGIAADKPFENLRKILVFTPKEEDLLTTALQKMGTDNDAVQRLLRKMSKVYEMSKLNSTLDQNFLTKLDKLEKAKTDKRCVLLKEYHSTNSSSVSDRCVEAFHISPEDDIVHAFDLKIGDIRHFRISRIPKLDILDTTWQHEGHHVIQNTDCFRIHDNQQVRVHLRMKVGGYNALLEAYPTARGHIKPVLDEPELYDFMGNVNHKFTGLTNFIMGNATFILAIYEPDELVEHIRVEARQLLERRF